MFMSPQWQFNHLQDMAGDAMDAWENELDSRVAQSREMRRMDHEKWIEALRQQTILQRLAMEQRLTQQQMRMKDRQNRIDADREAGITFSTEWGKY